MTSQEKIDLIARTDPFELIGEIERLTRRCELAEQKLDDVIEECARVVLRETEQASYPLTVALGQQMAAAIRALKDKA